MLVTLKMYFYRTRATQYEEQQSQLTWTPEISHTMSYQPGNIHRLVEGPVTYIAEDCLVLPQWEKTHHILKRLEVPGRMEVR